jgi:hypothetical protein
MDARMRRRRIRLAVAAAIIVAVTICVFAAIRLAVSSYREAAIGHGLGQPRSQAEGFRPAARRVATPGRKSAAREKYESLHSETRKTVEARLHSVRADLHMPATMRLNRENEVTLVVGDGAGGEPESPSGVSIPVEVKLLENAVTEVSAWLLPLQTDAVVTLRDGGQEKQGVAPGERTRWIWIVVPKEPGALQLEMSSWVKSDAGVGTVEYPDPDAPVPIDVSWTDRSLFYLDEVGTAGQVLTALIATLTAAGSVLGIFRGFGFRLLGLRLAGRRPSTDDVGLRT